MLYLYGYNSDKTLIKHLSFICLSIAAAFKIYPTIFGFLLLKEKRWKDAIIYFIYGISIFILPIVFVGGFSKFPLFINNLINEANSISSLIPRRFQLSINNLIDIIAKQTHLVEIKNFSTLITIIVLVIGMLIILFAKFKEKWKIIAIPTMLMISIPKFSFIYSMIYIIIPLIYFINEEKLNRKDKIYLFLFIFKLGLFPIKTTGYVESLGLYTMMIMLYIEGTYSILKKPRDIINIMEKDNRNNL